MNIHRLWLYIVIIMIILGACKKEQFLNKKPYTSILTPKTLSDFQGLLENIDVINAGGIAFPLLGCDEYTISYTNLQSLDQIQRNSYIWATDIYEGAKGESEWDRTYSQIFYANSVLDGLAKSDSASTPRGQYIKGWALFVRSYAFYDLTRNYGKAYDASTAKTDLGIPLRLKSGIDYIEPRANLQQCFDQIINDLKLAGDLLPFGRPSANLNRPSKIAAYAMLARIYLDKRDYIQAENNADKCLAIYNSLIDYNLVDKDSSTPFSITNDELIYNASQIPQYSYITGAVGEFSYARINPELINLYDANDLRLILYYSKLADGSYVKKSGYYGFGFYPFMGLATDEVYLIKAECLARRGETNASMDKLNQLLIKRLSNSKNYEQVKSNTSEIALSIILKERRKELVWRGLRWHDLKRLNKEGANITLKRTLNGITYTLPPNDNRWVFPIYPDEIALSGIQQNPR